MSQAERYLVAVVDAGDESDLGRLEGGIQLAIVQQMTLHAAMTPHHNSLSTLIVV
jgi:hypothetical protein